MIKDSTRQYGLYGMETIGQQSIWSFVKVGRKAEKTTCTQIRHSEATVVGSFMDLAKKIAELQFINRDFVLVFRGNHQTGSISPVIRRSSHQSCVQTILRRFLLKTNSRLVTNNSNWRNKLSSNTTAVAILPAVNGFDVNKFCAGRYYSITKYAKRRFWM